MERQFAAWLSAQPVVSALLGDRIYPLVLPQNSGLPAATYQRIGGERFYDLDGGARPKRVTLQLDSWAADYAGAKALAGAIESVLDGYAGPMGDLVVSRSVILREDEEHEDQTKLWRVSVDYQITAG
ncbi:MAG: DUF3168 domain-containing protein [Oceanibaculum nanhaiense]|jgi:hypothetical protein|uniref:DUF3168 domain-containing protein n=1 Tax=Oceanibaculum nanhaiense TaxID=1909734 RepID=UPI0032EF77FC